MIKSRYALIIANDSYQDDDLNSRQHFEHAQDADSLANVLADPTIGGFEVDRLLNQPSSIVRKGVENFFGNRSPEDLALVYIAGHGVTDKRGELFFAAKDTTSRHLPYTSVPANFISQVMGRRRSQSQMMFLDCAFSKLTEQGVIGALRQPIDIRTYFEGQRPAILDASQASQSFLNTLVQRDRAHVHSIFVQALLRGLLSGKADLNEDGKISLEELVKYVSKLSEIQQSESKLRLWNFDHLKDFVFAHNKARIETVFTRTFNLEIWKKSSEASLRNIESLLIERRKEDSSLPLYSYLSSATLFPLAMAVRSGGAMGAGMALAGIFGGVGGTLIANKVQQWVDLTGLLDESTLADQISREVTQNETLRVEVDTILEKLAVVSQVQAYLPEWKQQLFVQFLRDELKQMGNLPRFEAQLSGTGSIAQGEGASAAFASAGGVAAIAGSLGGNVDAVIAARDVKKIVETTEAYATARIVDHQPDHPFHLDNTYVLQAGIRSEIAEGFETASILLPSTEETIQFEIVVHAEDMAVQPALMQSYIFNRSQETPLLKFELRPHEPGRKQIRVEFFYQRHWLAQINFEVEVVPAPESIPVQ